ncbi:MAG: putative polymerase subfamily sigma factor [Acidimicrobiales bacterium]|nr:putative polymerase subfamily sigma factor [Acidimicrobiales bacterium]
MVTASADDRWRSRAGRRLRGRAEDPESARRRDGALVRAALAGDELAFGQLFDRWIDRVVAVAAQVVRDQSLAADVAQDVLIGAWQKLDQLREPDAFGPWILRSARNAAVSQVRRDARTQAVGDMTDVENVNEALEALAGLDDPADLVHRKDLAALVWQAAEALDHRDRSLLDLHLRHGLNPSELAEELGVQPNNAHQIMFRLRKRLSVAVEAYLLWNNGSPVCTELNGILAARALVAFDAVTASAIDLHAADCPVCTDHRRTNVAPVVLFSALPIVAAPWALKVRIAAGLDDAGVPVSGSAVVAGAAAASSLARGGATVMAAAATVVTMGLVWSLAGRNARPDPVAGAATVAPTTAGGGQPPRSRPAVTSRPGPTAVAPAGTAPGGPGGPGGPVAEVRIDRFGLPSLVVAPPRRRVVPGGGVGYAPRAMSTTTTRRAP